MSTPIQEFLKPYRVLSTNIYAIPPETFQKLDIKTWKYNRPPTESRISEIREWNIQFNRMDGVLNLAYIPGEGLVCFEGNHRRLALRDLPITVFADILWDVNDEIVMHEFRRINKSVSVPELYVVETQHNLKCEIENYVSDFRKKYKSHEVTTANPQRPNFNRDGLTDQITRLQKETGLTINELAVKLETLNEKNKAGSRTNMSAKLIEKCSKSGLWLFASSTVISSKDLI